MQTKEAALLGRFFFAHCQTYTHGNISITEGEDLTGFIKTSCFTRVSSKTRQVSPKY